MHQKFTLTAIALAAATACATHLEGTPIVDTTALIVDTTAPSLDTTAPTVRSTAPLAKASGRDPIMVISATFSELLDPRSVDETTFTVTQGASPVAGTVSVADHLVFFAPKEPLNPGSDYTANLSTGVADLAGNHLAAEHTWRFQIAPAEALKSPVVVGTVPLYGAVDGAADAVLRLKVGDALALVCVDSDADRVCDANDRCPTVQGPVATQGCPVDPCAAAPIAAVVLFDLESSAMPPPIGGAVQTMDPVLDAVAAAIARDPTCRVCIVGHTSMDGPSDQNLTLSSARALEVQDHLVARGLDRGRIPALGVGERCPIVPADTRLANRRVEFRRLHAGDGCPTDCAPSPGPR